MAQAFTCGLRAGGRGLFAVADVEPFGRAAFVAESSSIGGRGSSWRISSKSDFMLSTLKSLSAVV